MREGRKRAGGSSSDGRSERTSGTRRQPAEERLARLGRAVGNAALRDRLGAGGAARDALLEHVATRVRAIREVQLDELALVSRRQRWWKAVADRGKAEATLPAPRRWEEAARLYREAAEHLARGALGRGAELVEQAVAAEERAFDRLTSLVDVAGRAPGSRPEALRAVASGQACGACAVPTEIRDVAFAIERVGTELAPPPNRRRARDPWWTFDEEAGEGADEPGGS